MKLQQLCKKAMRVSYMSVLKNGHNKKKLPIKQLAFILVAVVISLQLSSCQSADHRWPNRLRIYLTDSPNSLEEKRIFRPSDEFTLVVTSFSEKEKEVKVEWLSPEDEIIGGTATTIKRGTYIFSLSSPQAWEAGEYHARLWAGENKVFDQVFEVR